MCGFAGLIGPAGQPGAQAQLAHAMASTLEHRGPDDAGSWSNETGCVGLGFRRLSIIDLSPEGHQPMQSSDRRYTVVFNGEIYNFEALKSELRRAGHTFRGHSDTEVLLCAISHWGMEDALPRLWGMFAFALWDEQEQRLHLVRDRVGKKPLYYGWFGQHFLFGSELKALRAHPAFTATVDRDALASYLRFVYVPAPLSIYEGVSKLPAGSWTTIEPDRPGHSPVPRTYWQAQHVAEHGNDHPLRLSDKAAADELERLLDDATGLRAVADVPVGAFLSGGIDSTVVVASLQKHSRRGVSTFTIGYTNDQYDESVHARAIAQHLGTEHTELIVSPAEARAVIPRLPSLYDEPFADASQIPTFLVSELARQHVTVALSGDGGDEVFGGYNRYVMGTWLWARLKRIPAPARRAAARTMLSIAPDRWDRMGRRMDPFMPSKRRSLVTGNNAHKLAGILDADSVDVMYSRLVATWDNADDLVIGAGTSGTRSLAASTKLDAAHQMMLHDMLTYLPDDILVKVDRASMGASLEVRTPLLDHRLIEFASRLPDHQLIRDGEGKWLLRQVLQRHVPRELFDRPKHGFGVPIDAWLRGPLRDWATDLLSPSRLRREGYFEVDPVQKALSAHLSGERNLQYHLWAILMFESWLENEHEAGRCPQELTM